MPQLMPQLMSQHAPYQSPPPHSGMLFISLILYLSFFAITSPQTYAADTSEPTQLKSRVLWPQAEPKTDSATLVNQPDPLTSPITTLLPDEILEYSTSEMIHTYKRTPFMRLQNPVSRLKIDPLNKLRLAFIEAQTQQLKIVHLNKKFILTVATAGIDQSFSWTPDGSRILYRRQTKKHNQIHGLLAIYDYKTRKSYPIDTMAYFTGIPTLDPRSGEFLLLHAHGIIRKKIHLPEARLARWQKSRGDHNGLFAVTPKSIMHISPTQRGVHQLIDDGSGIQSYRISHDGTKITWATHDNKIYVARDDWNYHKTQAKLIGYGLDPTWSDDGEWVIFAGARTVGQTVSGYDLRKVNLQGEGTWLTKTFQLQERWPTMLRDGTILFTIENTTDLFVLETLNSKQTLPLLSKTTAQ